MKRVIAVLIVSAANECQLRVSEQTAAATDAQSSYSTAHGHGLQGKCHLRISSFSGARWLEHLTLNWQGWSLNPFFAISKLGNCFQST